MQISENTKVTLFTEKTNNVDNKNTAQNSSVDKEVKSQVKSSIKNTLTFPLVKKVVDLVDENEIITAKTPKEYVADFNSNMKKSARATLEMCRTVYEASKTLGSDGFYSFCKEVGYKDDSSTIRKFIVIGKVYPRLIDYAEQLPLGWTNIYQLTQISADDFDKCIKSGFELKKLTGSELKELIGKTRDLNDVTSPFKVAKSHFGLKIGEFYFTKKIDDTDWRLVEKAFDEVCSRLPVRIMLNQDASNLFAARRLKKYEMLKKEDDNTAVKPHKWDYGSVANKVVDAEKVVTA